MNYKLSYTNVLEIILFVILLYFLFSWINGLYVCNVSYNIIDVNTSVVFNFSLNDSRDYYISKEYTLFVLDKNKYLSEYNSIVRCNYKFLLKK